MTYNIALDACVKVKRSFGSNILSLDRTNAKGAVVRCVGWLLTEKKGWVFLL